jgi:transcriptional regulator with XRE-family HTH domain
MLTPTSEPCFAAVTADDRAFYAQLGQRIASLRRSRGLTQVQLAEQLGVAQQTLAHYEAGRLRLLAGALPKLAEFLDSSVEDLIGEVPARGKPGKRGPAPKIQQQLERVSALPKAKQRVIVQVLDSMLAQAGR